MKYQAILANYRFTRTDDKPMSEDEIQALDSKLFELIGEFATDNELGVEGGSALEHAASGE